MNRESVAQIAYRQTQVYTQPYALRRQRPQKPRHTRAKVYNGRTTVVKGNANESNRENNVESHGVFSGSKVTKPASPW